MIGTSAYSQDSVIFSFTPDGSDGMQSPTEGKERAKGEDPTPLLAVSRTPAKHKQSEKFDVSPGDLVAISLDCATGVVEYYKNSVCIKTAILFVAKPEAPAHSQQVPGSASRGRSRESTAGTRESDDRMERLSRRGSRGAVAPEVDESPAEETVWYPFATLYEKGQSVRFVKAG